LTRRVDEKFQCSECEPGYLEFPATLVWVPDLNPLGVRVVKLRCREDISSTARPSLRASTGRNCGFFAATFNFLYGKFAIRSVGL
jgi:hypothetical protein